MPVYPLNIKRKKTFNNELYRPKILNKRPYKFAAFVASQLHATNLINLHKICNVAKVCQASPLTHTHTSIHTHTYTHPHTCQDIATVIMLDTKRVCVYVCVGA